jgi:hypothetical protein
LRASFKRWWKQRGGGDPVVRRATWRAVAHNQNESGVALGRWDGLGPEEARRRGTQVLADLLRHVGRISEQMVTLRAVQTLSLIDLLNYREHVYLLGEYAASGDPPESWLTVES